VRGAQVAPAKKIGSIDSISERLPADGIGAAANLQDLGTPHWQLVDKVL
jgi:hypothetical protein